MQNIYCGVRIGLSKSGGVQGVPRTMENLVSTLCYLARIGDDFRAYDLIDEGADPDQFSMDGWNALLYACDRGHLKFVELLLEKGARMDLCDEGGFTPLMQAADRNHPVVVKELLMRGADADRTNNVSRAALHLAAHAGNQQPATLLLDAGANLEIPDKDGWMPLHFACHGGYTDMARLLLGAGAKVDPITKLDETPLHLAAVTGTWQTTQALLAKGANPNVTTQDMWTPLHSAVWWGHELVADMLLRHQGDLTLKNKDGETPLDMAKRLGYSRVIKTLEARPARRISSSKVGDSDTESEEAVRPNRLETITISIDDRKFVTASRTMMCIPGSYFWLIMNPGGDPGPKFEHDADILELGPGPGGELKEVGKNEYTLHRNPVNFEFILDYLRQARYSRHRDVKLPEDKYLLADLLDEARFYRIPELVQTILDERTRRQKKWYKNVVTEKRRKRMVQSGSVEPQPKDMGKWYIPRFKKRRQPKIRDRAVDNY